MLNGINHINNLWFQFGLSQHWSNCEEIPYIQGQRSPSKMVGGAKAHLKSNPTPTRDCTLPDSGRGQTEPSAHQDWGERSSDPHKRLTQTFPWVSRSLWGRRQWVVPSAGLGALSVAVYAWDLLKEVAIIFITSTIVWPQVKQQGGNTAHQQKIGLKIYWAWPCPSEQDPVSPHRQSLPSGSLCKRTTALSDSVKLWAMPCKATQDGRVVVESSDKTWSTGEGNGKSLQYSCLENPMNSMKRQKDRTLRDELPGSVGAQYPTGDQWRKTPERMKRQSQSKNDTQLWMWLVTEAKTHALKSNIA